MVTRKPVPQSTNPSSNNPSSPPYPITPVSSNPPSNFRTEDTHNAMSTAPNAESNIWNEEEHSHIDPSILPDTLKVGPSRIPPKTSQDMLKPNPATTNPFLIRRQQSQNSQSAVSDGKESSADIWGELAEKPAHPDHPPPPPPPVSQGSLMSLLAVLIADMCQSNRTIFEHGWTSWTEHKSVATDSE